jgi:hypothetical protein
MFWIFVLQSKFAEIHCTDICAIDMNIMKANNTDSFPAPVFDNSKGLLHFIHINLYQAIVSVQ